MKRVLFIADMNDIVKNMNEAMLPFFQVQLCTADEEFIRKMIPIYQPDIVLVFLNQLRLIQVQELKVILDENEKLPVIMVGSMYEFREYLLDILLVCHSRQKYNRKLCKSWRRADRLQHHFAINHRHFVIKENKLRTVLLHDLKRL